MESEYISVTLITEKECKVAACFKKLDLEAAIILAAKSDNINENKSNLSKLLKGNNG